jgi:hypothetical protein
VRFCSGTFDNPGDSPAQNANGAARIGQAGERFKGKPALFFIEIEAVFRSGAVLDMTLPADWERKRSHQQ